MSSQTPYRTPEVPPEQSRPQGGASPGDGQYPPSQSPAVFPQQPGFTAQPSYPPTPAQPVAYQPVPQYAGFQSVTGTKANGPGIASLVLGIIGTVTAWTPWTFFVGLPTSIVGIFLAIAGMRRINGRGLAIAGLVLSIIGTVIAGIWALLLIIGLVAAGTH